MNIENRVKPGGSILPSRSLISRSQSKYRVSDKLGGNPVSSFSTKYSGRRISAIKGLRASYHVQSESYRIEQGLA